VSIPFPGRHKKLVEELAARCLIAQREKNHPDETLARDLLGGFYELCIDNGLEGILVAIHAALPHTLPAAPTPKEGSSTGLKALLADARFVPENFSEHPKIKPALIEKLNGARDGRTPEGISELLVGFFSLDLRGQFGPAATSLPDAVRTAIATTSKSEFDRAFAPGQLRTSILKRLEGERIGRTRAFKAMSPMVDERGGPPAYADVVFRHSELEAQQITNMFNSLDRGKALAVEEACRAATDHTKRILQESGVPEMAERIERAVSHRLTCFDVAVQRVIRQCDPVYDPAQVCTVFLESLSVLVPIEWQPPDPSANPLKAYGPTVKFAVGDRVGHKSFGEGVVVSCTDDRVIIDFSGERRTLVHGRS
jgi:hypothetical protein